MPPKKRTVKPAPKNAASGAPKGKATKTPRTPASDEDNAEGDAPPRKAPKKAADATPAGSNTRCDGGSSKMPCKCNLTRAELFAATEKRVAPGVPLHKAVARWMYSWCQPPPDTTMPSDSNARALKYPNDGGLVHYDAAQGWVCSGCKHPTGEHPAGQAAAPPPPSDPMEILTSAKVKHAKSGWNLAYPLFGQEQKLPATININALRNVGKLGGFDDAEKQVLAVLHSPTQSKGPLIIGVQAGMGIGKSHVVDISDQLLFVGQNPLLLKVSYNFGQDLASEAKRANEGLFARLVLALHQKVSPGCAKVVDKALEASKGAAKLTATAVATEVLSHSKPNQPIIVGVDEIGTLPTKGIRSVLSAIAAFTLEVHRQSNNTREIIALVTALPSVDIQSLSSRPPIFVTPPPFSEADAKAFLKQECPNATSSQLNEMATYCGGHPRSLAVAAMLFNRHNPPMVPAPNTVANGCFWKVKQGSRATVVRDAIKEAYCHGDRTLQKSMNRLYLNAMMMEREDGRFAIAPTVLWSDTKDEETLSDLHYLLRCHTRVAATKALEHTNWHWDFFRARNSLSVIPRSMTTPNGCTAHRFRFDPAKSIDKATILSNGGIHKSFNGKEIDETKYYYPAVPNHRAFESMCVAKSADGKEKTLCLFQSKINGALSEAITKLNVAAADLQKKHWKGKSSSILYVIFALKSSPSADTSAAKHPVLLVTENDLDDYFTATLAPGAKLCLIRNEELG